jgi:hybrid cluster-associated redox disulfide protein
MTCPITKEMSLAELLERCPPAAQVLLDAGMGCISCSVAGMETLAEGAELHGLNVDELVAMLNDLCGPKGKCTCSS